MTDSLLPAHIERLRDSSKLFVPRHGKEIMEMHGTFVHLAFAKEPSVFTKAIDQDPLKVFALPLYACFREGLQVAALHARMQSPTRGIGVRTRTEKP